VDAVDCCAGVLFPLEQATQVEEPEADWYDPTEHEEQELALLAEYLPASQAEHFEEASLPAVALTALPAAQAVHAVAPVTAA